MRSQLVQLGAWAAATGAAVALSWLGVHAVLADTVFEQPVAVPLPSPTATAADDREPGTATGTVGGESPAAPASSTAATQAATPAGPSPGRASATTAQPPPAGATKPSPTTSLHSYALPGGRVALDLRPDHAELVTATPDSGWQMQIWHGDQWMRIDFSQGGRTSSVFVTWNGHPPDVQTVPG
ncbi:hypothetical protein [Kitasatospora cinereorecta]|uniref:hypothetical protein n=1 Tax=Kitasatospora cinereorecta TaxID=285560 RepID=UPI0031F864EB